MKLHLIQISLLVLLCIVTSSNSRGFRFSRRHKQDQSSCPPKHIKPLVEYDIKNVLGPLWSIKCLPGIFCDNLYCFMGSMEPYGNSYTLDLLGYNKSSRSIFKSHATATVENGVIVTTGSTAGPDGRYLVLGGNKDWTLLGACVPNAKNEIKLGALLLSRTQELPPSEEAAVFKVLQENELHTAQFYTYPSKLCSLVQEMNKDV